jgi:hypothetical protein
VERWGVRSKKFGQQNPIKHEKGDPPDFLATLITPSNEFGQNPKNPPPSISKHCAAMKTNLCKTKKFVL